MISVPAYFIILYKLSRLKIILMGAFPFNEDTYSLSEISYSSTLESMHRLILQYVLLAGSGTVHRL